MTVPSKMFALKTFSAKDKSKNYYVADCITLDNANTPYLQGYSNVSVFIDEPMYNSLLSLFEPLMDVLALPFKSIAEGLKHLKDSFVTSITNLGSFIVNGIKALFVPSDNFFNSYLGSMKTTLDSKLPIVSQLKTLLDTFVDNFLNSNPTPPKFSFTYKGVECVLIDFSMYSQYRLYIHGFILVTSYYFFIIKVYKFLPRLIGGIT